MGLDMYLYRRPMHNTNDSKSEEVMYWRKSNQIRQWFVEHAGYPQDGNCEEVVISKDLLRALVKDCNTVLNDRSRADELIPTSDGFFFGGCDYEDWYFDDLERTAKSISNIINETDFDKHIIVYTDWW